MRDQALEAFGQPLDLPYLVGVLLAVNAVPDLAVLVDGPDCAKGKGEHIFGKHDLRSTLLDCRGRDRVECSFTDARNAALSREDAVRAKLRELAGRRDVSAVLTAALPLALVTGTDYGRVIREAARGSDKPILTVPSGSLRGGFLEGYDAALAALARGLPLPKVRPSPAEAAVVGCLLDRNEEDRRADVAELSRLVRGLGLRLSSVWLSGRPCRELARAARAGLIVALPHGREAARVLARRTGARLVDAGLPLGLEAAGAWVRAVARAAGREEAGEKLVARELRRVTPRLEWVVGHCFLNKRFWLAADARSLDALAGFVRELGGAVAGTASMGAPHGAPGRARDGLVRPTEGSWKAALDEAVERGLDLAVGPSAIAQAVRGRCAVLELGVPSCFTHALAPAPALGYEGCLGLAGRMLNAMSAHAAERAALGGPYAPRAAESGTGPAARRSL